MEADDYFDEKVAAATQSIARARTVFLISNIAAVIVVSANFNLYFSWLRNMLTRTVTTGTPYAEVMNALARSRVQDTAVISVPLIGMKFFAADIGILSGVSMLVLSVWLYYSFRREQHTVGRIALEVMEPQKRNDFNTCKIVPEMLDRAQYLLYGISAAFVFTTSTRGRLAIGDPKRDADRSPEPRITEWMTSVLVWAPFWTIAFSLGLDIASMFFPSALLAGAQLTDELKEQQTYEAYIRFAVTAALGILVGRVTANANYYSKWTARIYNVLARAVDDAETEEEAAKRRRRPRPGRQRQ